MLLSNPMNLPNFYVKEQKILIIGDNTFSAEMRKCENFGTAPAEAPSPVKYSDCDSDPVSE